MSTEAAGPEASHPSQPFVTVLTPVFNGASYLAECIESVLAQDYSNWEYVIVDNCSSDGTRAIAETYCARDPRVRVTTNETFLSLSQNFNHACRLVSPRSRYFKILCADDWIDSRFLTKMVAFAEAHPSVGIVSCQQWRGTDLRCAVLPESVTWLPGREACRKVLLEDAWILPPPTGALYRTSLLQPDAPFFPNEYPHCDLSACLEHLQHCDLGVVHEALAFERAHEGQVSARVAVFYASAHADLEMLVSYGPRYLLADELRRRRTELMSHYYTSMGRGLLQLRGADFWSFHRRRLGDLGLELQPRRVVEGALRAAYAELRHPVEALRKARRGLRKVSGSPAQPSTAR
jgi:glycosyltransferase involved in cell wall biosynthesis